MKGKQKPPMVAGRDVSHLRELTRLMFEIGFRAESVAARWPAFETAFAGFEPAAVALFGPAQLEAMSLNPALIRNRAKLAATVDNARAMVRLSSVHGSFDALLDSLRSEPYERRARLLTEVFTRVGPRIAFAFLLSVGLAEPSDVDTELGDAA